MEEELLKIEELEVGKFYRFTLGGHRIIFDTNEMIYGPIKKISNLDIFLALEAPQKVDVYTILKVLTKDKIGYVGEHSENRDQWKEVK